MSDVRSNVCLGFLIVVGIALGVADGITNRLGRSKWTPHWFS